MITLYDNPARQQWAALSTRPSVDTLALEELVSQVFEEVERKGDAAVRKYTSLFDGVDLESYCLKLPSLEALEDKLDQDFISSINTAANNIEAFHEAQKREAITVETMPGIVCWQKQTPIQKVGLYIPAGSAPLFSTLLMLAIPARIAGCTELVLCSPPAKDGGITAEMQYAARLCGIDRIYTVGGIQAVAALSYGTDKIPAVDKIFGPGNQYVTAAKQFAQRKGLAIDLPAGPSEVLVYLDDVAYAPFVAADLLSQAEHGPDSQVVLVASEQQIVAQVIEQVEQQLERLPRADIARKALQNARAIVFEELEDSIGFINNYAPEHLILISGNEDRLIEEICNAGSVFLGAFTPESLGDYASGTNHTLPTSGFAKRYGGVDLSSFQKPITYQRATKKGLELLGPSVVTLARAEQLEGHAQAVLNRLNTENR